MKQVKREIGSYKGRPTVTEQLRRVALVLLVLVVLAGAGLFFGQRYIVYTDDGLRVEPPFLKREEDPAPQKDLGEVKVVVEPAQAQSEEEADRFWLRAVWMPLEAVEQGTLARQVKELGANAAILDMKTDLGGLGFISQQPMAIQAQVNPEREDINQQLRRAAGEDVYLIARLSCFRDDALAGQSGCALESVSGGAWADRAQVRWSSPASQEAQEYLVGLMTELAQMGFDEILLEHWGYPDQEEGELEQIKPGSGYDPEKLEVAVTQFIQRAQQALAEYGVCLSVRTSAGVLEDSGRQRGQSVQQMKELTGRIWLESRTEKEALVRQLEQAGMAQADVRLVEIVEALDQDGAYHQECYPEKQG